MVEVKDFQGYLGGLSSSGKECARSVYKKQDEHEIMYHVGTLLRHCKDDDQQVQKKKHIGNDNVVIVFQESSACVLKSDFLKSNMVYAVIVVQNQSSEVNEQQVNYKMSVCAKSFVSIEDLELPKSLAEGKEMGLQECKDLLFHLILRVSEIAWNSGDLKAKLERCRENEIEMWAQ